MAYKFDTIIEGEFVTLKKVELNDAPDIYKWRSGESGKFMRHPTNYSLESQREWIKNSSEAEITYIIYQNISFTKIGMVGIYDVNNNDLVCNVGRLLLDETYLTKSTPFGLETLLLAYEYVFDKMQFRKICGDILATNTEMFKLQKFLGMQQEGYLKNHVIIKDKCHDLYIMSLFKEDFNNYKNKINFLLRSFRK